MRAPSATSNNHFPAPRAAPPRRGIRAGLTTHGLRPPALPSIHTLLARPDDLQSRTDVSLPPMPSLEITLPYQTFESQAHGQQTQFDIPVRQAKRPLDAPQFTTPDYGPPPTKRKPSVVECPNGNCGGYGKPCYLCGFEPDDTDVAERNRSLSPDYSTPRRMSRAGTSSRSVSVSGSRRGSRAGKPLKNPNKADKEKDNRAEQGKQITELGKFHQARGWKGANPVKGRNHKDSGNDYKKANILKESVRYVYWADERMKSQEDHIKELGVCLGKKDAEFGSQLSKLRAELDTLRRELNTERAHNAQRRASRCSTPDSSVSSSASTSPRTQRYLPPRIKRENL